MVDLLVFVQLRDCVERHVRVIPKQVELLMLIGSASPAKATRRLCNDVVLAGNDGYYHTPVVLLASSPHFLAMAQGGRGQSIIIVRFAWYLLMKRTILVKGKRSLGAC